MRTKFARIAAEIVFATAALLAAELLIGALSPPRASQQQARIDAAARIGVQFDARSVSQVVADLRAAGVDALPGLSRNWPQNPQVRSRLGDEFYPLSQASNATVVECNESGEYLAWASDELGFNNPPGLIAAADVDIALVGESFGLGYCLPQESSLAGRLRGVFPRTVNLAMAGTRTLTQLASFREYAEPLRPKVVLWLVNPHFVEAPAEFSDARLTRYLDPGFSQNLTGRQHEVDAVVRGLALPRETDLDAAQAAAGHVAFRERLESALYLTQIRDRAVPAITGQIALLETGPTSDPSPPALESFLQCLALAQRTADQWGGRLVVVLTPIYAETVAYQVRSPLRHDELSAAVGALGIPVVDPVPVFRDRPDPASLYMMGRNNHPTAEGYAIIAGLIEAEIRRHLQSSGPESMENGA